MAAKDLKSTNSLMWNSLLQQLGGDKQDTVERPGDAQSGAIESTASPLDFLPYARLASMGADAGAAGISALARNAALKKIAGNEVGSVGADIGPQIAKSLAGTESAEAAQIMPSFTNTKSMLQQAKAPGSSIVGKEAPAIKNMNQVYEMAEQQASAPKSVPALENMAASKAQQQASKAISMSDRFKNQLLQRKADALRGKSR